MRDVDVVVIGAGVVGLAAAASLARAGRSVIVLEREDGIARGVTSRNSEVVHAGLYYPPDSLKAELCVRGREQLYAWCGERGVGHRRIGKLVVAGDEPEVGVLERLYAQGLRNGAGGLELLDAAAAQRLEPDVRCAAALWSPETGIVDAHALCVSLQAEAEAHDAVLLMRHEVVGARPRGRDWVVEARAGEAGEVQPVGCAAVVVATGLESDRVAALAGVDVDAAGVRQHPCKGDYFALAPGVPLSLGHLVYPVPAGAGLGIHATLDLAGSVRFGPDAAYVEQIDDWQVDAAKAEPFAEAIRRYLPAMRAEWLRPDYAGIRPKRAAPGEGFRDFLIAEQSAAGLPGLVVCAGIESPGLTSALAIGERIAELI